MEAEVAQARAAAVWACRCARSGWEWERHGGRLMERTWRVAAARGRVMARAGLSWKEMERPKLGAIVVDL